MTATSRIGVRLAAGFAIPLGVLAASAPRLAIAGLLALGFVALAVHDIAAGVAAFSVLTLMEEVPPVAGTPVVKLAGALLVVLLLRDRLGLARLLHERPAMACAAGFLAIWAGVTSLWAENPWVALSSTFRLAAGVVFLFVVYGAVRERKHVRWIVHAFVFGAFIVVLMGAAGITPGVVQGRFVGAAGQPNQLASILVPALALGGFAFASSASRVSRVLISVSLVGILYALLLTGSRGGLVGVAIALVGALILGGPLRKHVVVMLVVAVGIGVAYYGFVANTEAQNRVASFTAEGGTGRLDLWTVSASVVADRPLLGVGAGNFPIVEPSYAIDAINLSEVRFIVDTPKVAHNTFLELQAELGVPGLIAFLLVVGAALVGAVRAITAAVELGDRELEYLARGITVGLVGFLATATFGSFQYHKQLWLLLGLAAALPFVVSQAGQGRQLTAGSDH